MKDYEKADQAVTLLEESGVEIIFAYINEDNTCATGALGKYTDIRRCTVGVMSRLAIKLKEDGYSPLETIGILNNLTLHAVKLAQEAEEEKE